MYQRNSLKTPIMLSYKKGKSTLYYATRLWLIISVMLFLLSLSEMDASSGFRGFNQFISIVLFVLITIVYVIIVLVHIFRLTFNPPKDK